MSLAHATAAHSSAREAAKGMATSSWIGAATTCRQRCFPERKPIGWTVDAFSGASNLRGAHQTRHPVQGAKGRRCQPMPSSRRWTHAAASRPADACNNSVPVDHGKMPLVL